MTADSTSRTPIHLLHLALVGLIATTLLTGCGNEGVQSPIATEAPELTTLGTGTLAVSLQVSDEAEGPIAAADQTTYSIQNGVRDGGRWQELEDLATLFMTFDAVRIYPVSADSCVPGGQPGECDYLEFPVDPVTVDVNELDVTLTEVLGTLQVPLDEYHHLAIHLAELWGENPAGEIVTVSLPEASDGYLKIMVPFTVEEGSVTEIVIVIDLNRSVHEYPAGSGEYVLIPVLRGEVWGPGSGPHHGGGLGGGPGSGSGNGSGSGPGGGSGNGSGSGPGGGTGSCSGSGAGGEPGTGSGGEPGGFGGQYEGGFEYGSGHHGG